MELYDLKTIQTVLGRHGFTFSKALGQNFLVDPDICPEMARLSGCNRDTLVIEIGPGIGVLTKELCRNAGAVVAIELDKRLAPVLKETLCEFDNFELIMGDVMELPLQQIIEEKRKHFSSVRICANLPYYITSPILMRLLEQQLTVDSITVMVQKEAAIRLCAAVGSRDSGAVTVAVHYYAESEVLFQVPRDCFYPAPKVDSAVIHLRVRREPPVQLVNENHFFSMVKAAFAQRRKTAANSISAGLSIDKTVVAAALYTVGAAPTVRAEQLTMEQLAALSNVLFA